MSVVSLEYFKESARIDAFAFTDEFLERKLRTAEDLVIRFTNRTREELEEMNGGEFPLPLEEAIVIYATNLVENPTGVAAVQMSEIPYQLQAIIKQFRKLSDR